MPVKWTPETDQILLLKILETSHVSTDAKAISAAWPESHETPTPRAISERIFKIKSIAKSSSSSSSSAPSSPQKIKSDPSPRRIKSDKKDAAPSKATGSPRSKRKRAGADAGAKAEANGHSYKYEQPVPDDDLYGDDSPADSTETKKVKPNPPMESAETGVPDVWFGLN